MHRFLAVVIALLLAGGLAAAIVKNDRTTKPEVLATSSPSPSQTYTYDGLPPTVASETPIVTPTETPAVAGTETQGELARTGSTSTVTAAALMLCMALVGGLAVRRAARGPR